MREEGMIDMTDTTGNCKVYLGVKGIREIIEKEIVMKGGIVVVIKTKEIMIDKEIDIDTKKEDIEKDLTLILAHHHKAATDVSNVRTKREDNKENVQEADLFMHDLIK